MASRTENWSIGDFLSHFEKAIDRAVDQRFKDKFHALAGELELLDTEFLKEQKGCGTPLDALIDKLQSLTGRLGYCEHPRGFEAECDTLYRDVDAAVKSVSEFRLSCSG
jgi:hypothetical protein